MANLGDPSRVTFYVKEGSVKYGEIRPLREELRGPRLQFTFPYRPSVINNFSNRPFLPSANHERKRIGVNDIMKVGKFPFIRKIQLQ